MDTTKSIVAILRGFVKQRQAAYRAIMKAGHPIPLMTMKREAIDGILAQLDFIEGKPEHSQKICIAAIIPKFKMILPYEYADNPATLTIRQKITNILTACEDQVNAKPLFS